ncbi:transaldolase family protein [Shigella flexneri]
MVSVSEIYQYYKEHGYETVVMGASFRNMGEIWNWQAATVLPSHLHCWKELAASEGAIGRGETVLHRRSESRPARVAGPSSCGSTNQDPMAVDQLAEGDVCCGRKNWKK